MTLDPNNPVIALCAAGMAVEGTPQEAGRLFAQAWDARQDDFDACIAAHFVARQQASAGEALRWNERAIEHARAVPDGRAAELLASLYLNLGEAYANVGRVRDAADAVRLGVVHLPAVAPGGYRELVALGLRRLALRLGQPDDATAE